MRISDWSSDVCSSDLVGATPPTPRQPQVGATPPTLRTIAECTIEPKAHESEGRRVIPIRGVGGVAPTYGVWFRVRRAHGSGTLSSSSATSRSTSQQIGRASRRERGGQDG